MKVLSEKLSSFTFTILVLVGLIFWMTWGILMAGSNAYADRFALMNSRLLRGWFMAPEGKSALLKFWFAGLCFLVALLGVNLIFCSWNRTLRIMRAKLRWSGIVMLVIHVVFGLVVLGHLGSFVVGYRYEKVLLREGQSFRFRDGHVLKVERVHFVDDPAILKRHLGYLSADKFHYRRDFADIVLSRDGKEVMKDRVYILRPARQEGVQITLARFAFPGRISGFNRGKDPQAVFVVSKNPVLTGFLVVYAVMIVGMGIYLAATWQNPGLKMNC